MNKSNVKEAVWAAAFAAEAEKRHNSTNDARMCVHRADWAVGMLETVFRNDLAAPLAEEPLEVGPHDEEIRRLKDLLRQALPFVDMMTVAGIRNPLTARIEEVLK